MIPDLIQELQDDVWGVLTADSGFCHVPVYRVRSPLEKDADGEPLPGRSMVIEDSLDDALAGIKAKNGKGGIAAIVMLPDVKPVSQNSLGPSMIMMQKIRIVENRIFNEGRKGTGISASRLALHTVQVLNRRMLRGGTLLIPDASKMIEEVSLPDNVMVHEVNMECTQGVGAPLMAAKPDVSAEGREITLASSTSTAQIWYTLDGSYPVPGASLLYDGPFSLPDGIHILRTIALADGMTPSHDIFATLTI